MKAFSSIRNLVKRPRLISALAAAIVCYAVASPFMTTTRAFLLAYNLGSLLYFVLAFWMMVHATEHTIRRRAKEMDDNRWTQILAIVVFVGAVLVALMTELHGAKSQSIYDIALALLTLGVSWFLIVSVFLHAYADVFYTQPAQLDFPKTPVPLYWDFLYFSTIISMCFQVADVSVTATHTRRIVMVQSIISFIFNVFVLAVSVNILAGVI